jgi:hypothetical protein
MKKQLFNSFLKTVSVVVLLASIFIAEKSEAQNPYPISSVTVTGLQNFVPTANSRPEYYLTAYYALGKPNGFSLQESSDELFLSKMYVKVADLPIENDTLVLPPQSIWWTSYDKPNVLVLVVHSQKEFTWQNSNIEGGQPDLAAGVTVNAVVGSDNKTAFVTTKGIASTNNTTAVSFSSVSFRWLTPVNNNPQIIYKFNLAHPVADFVSALTGIRPK